MMNETDHKPTSRRIYRELTREERARVAKARAEAAAKRDEIVREGRIHKAVTLDEVLPHKSLSKGELRIGSPRPLYLSSAVPS